MYLLAIDQGTTGTTVVLYDEAGKKVAFAYRELRQIYPQPGWVEQDPEEIWQTVVDCVLEICPPYAREIAAVGITNQRETTVLWDRKTGQPIHNAVVWQCRRTTELCEALTSYQELFRQKTGLSLDPYFSGTKIRWILEHTKATDSNDVLFGNVDSWLLWKLTAGRVHATDYTNASRTMIFDIHKKQWDEDLANLCGVPLNILPEVRNSASQFGVVSNLAPINGVMIAGIAGDQQAALFGQACFKPGQMKNTYGTGCFLLMNTGQNPIGSRNGLITTLAIDRLGKPCYALEGSVFTAGSAVQWLRDELGLIKTAAETESAATSVEDTNGAFFVPAFTGLGAPHWDANARGLFTGLTRGINRNHLIRAVLEAMAYQTYDVVQVMTKDTDLQPSKLAVDGGACQNDFLMQFQADILNLPMRRPANIESTSLGAVFLAGLTAGIWNTCDQLSELNPCERSFYPDMNDENRERLLLNWHTAVKRALSTSC